MPVLNILKKVPIFSDLKEKDLKKMESILKGKTYGKGDHIFSESDEGDEFYIVDDGLIKIYKMSTDGQVKALDYLKKGDFFGEMALLDKNPRSANALAMENANLFIIKYSDFRQFLISQPEILLTITQTLCKRLRKTDMEIEMFSFKKVKDRLVLCLVHLAEKYGKERDDGIEILMGITHQDLSEFVGTAREVISRQLKELDSEGLIKKDGRGLIIPSISKLRKKLYE
ncbi:MAG: Crp/Fnr family transcriptional regulator [Elusimicrobiota bacterium]